MVRETYYHDANIAAKLDRIEREVELLNRMLTDTKKTYRYKLVKEE